MKLKVLLFGITREIAAQPTLTVEMPDGSRVVDLKSKLQNNYPAFQNLRSLAVAVNSEYADETQPLSTNDEIALIPPVSGG